MVLLLLLLSLVITTLLYLLKGEFTYLVEIHSEILRNECVMIPAIYHQILQPDPIVCRKNKCEKLEQLVNLYKGFEIFIIQICITYVCLNLFKKTW